MEKMNKNVLLNMKPILRKSSSYKQLPHPHRIHDISFLMNKMDFGRWYCEFQRKDQVEIT